MNILLVEDNRADMQLVREALTEAEVPVDLHWVATGEEALSFLRHQVGHADRPKPDLVLLDLNLPGLHGHEVLAAIKGDARLLCIPVVVLTSSSARQDVLAAYELHANGYTVKPEDFDQFLALARSIHAYWLTSVLLPGRAT